MVLTENEKKEILNKHNIYKKDIIVKEALSLNENYVIFLDELYDVNEKKHLGNIWEDLNHFILFFNAYPRQACFWVSILVSFSLLHRT